MCGKKKKKNLIKDSIYSNEEDALRVLYLSCIVTKPTPGANGPQCSSEWTAIKASFNILDFQLPWKQIKMRNLYDFFMLYEGLLKEHL